MRSAGRGGNGAGSLVFGGLWLPLLRPLAFLCRCRGAGQSLSFLPPSLRGSEAERSRTPAAEPGGPSSQRGGCQGGVNGRRAAPLERPRWRGLGGVAGQAAAADGVS